MNYSKELKDALLRRMLPPNNESITKISKEEGISEQTLRNWRDKARRDGYAAPETDALPDDWSTQDKFLVVVEMCFVNKKSSKLEGKFPTFRSGNPHYPKETCREFSFFSLSSRKESSIHCFLPNRVIRVRLCQRLPERFAFNVLSFDSASAPG